MINFSSENNFPKKSVKAVGLISGGLDSCLAAKIVQDLGVEVHGVFFTQPWGCCQKSKAMEVAQKLGIKLIVLQLDERYLEMIKKPRFGYGSALNPCVDCRVHMFSRAKKYMDSIAADFVFTGEVLGQRPMSQVRHRMETIEKHTGLRGRLLRPLSAQLFEPTIPEQEGLINREKLLAITGRSRQEQIKLAQEFDFGEYSPPAGGCLLTDQHFAKRMKDTLQYGYRNFRETISLKWGRHFRLSPEFKIIVGRDEQENLGLKGYAHPDDYVFEFRVRPGPTVILKGNNPPERILKIAAGLVQKFSSFRHLEPLDVIYYKVSDENQVFHITAQMLPDEQLNLMAV